MIIKQGFAATLVTKVLTNSTEGLQESLTTSAAPGSYGGLVNASVSPGESFDTLTIILPESLSMQNPRTMMMPK